MEARVLEALLERLGKGTSFSSANTSVYNCTALCFIFQEFGEFVWLYKILVPQILVEPDEFVQYEPVSIGSGLSLLSLSQKNDTI